MLLHNHLKLMSFVSFLAASSIISACRMDNLEFASLIASFATFFLGQFFFVTSLKYDSTVRGVLSFAIVAANLAFILYAIFHFWKIIKELARDKISAMSRSRKGKDLEDESAPPDTQPSRPAKRLIAVEQPGNERELTLPGSVGTLRGVFS
jgi:hypothetical protein